MVTAMPTESMELHTLCESDLRFAKKQSQRLIYSSLFCLTIVARVTSSELKNRLIRLRTLSIAWGHACLSVSSGLPVMYGSGPKD